MIQSATVIGAGSWGTALAALLSWRGLDVQFWGRDAELMAQLQDTRRSARYLPDLELPPQVRVTSDFHALQPADMLVFVVPSKAMLSTAQLVAQSGAASRARVLVSCSKGIELETGRRMTELIGSAIPGVPLAVLTGPNHAEEVARQMATAAVVACADDDIAKAVQACFTLPFFRTYTTDDIVGAEWAGAMKNPYAIAAGIAHGLKMGDNTLAALVTRALAEMVRLGMAEGGKVETFYGLSGVGDLMGTCYSEHSRNHRVGMMLGQGRPLDEIISSTRMVAEGVLNTASLHRAAQARGVRMPLLGEIYAVLHQGKSPKEGMRDLFSRDPRPEAD
ncbi:NAD(P)H-dependent glycerol-3-phosphate dehydrogenase [Prosthecobacter fluviatilis]|uniref:Glycerol-3-phosphate dehydrogenase [NAD(P)+] n=1 Tax=Prosthecobacter fluviatilis TaxID=445931 RepID=A0ABW0KKB8_9BACT